MVTAAAHSLRGRSWTPVFFWKTESSKPNSALSKAPYCFPFRRKGEREVKENAVAQGVFKAEGMYAGRQRPVQHPVLTQAKFPLIAVDLLALVVALERANYPNL